MLGDDRERVLIAILRDPKATRSRIVRDFHITQSVAKQQRIFETIPFAFENGEWIPKRKAVAAD